jgi:hypothetical protein
MGMVDHLSKSRGPPVVLGADFRNHCLNLGFGIVYKRGNGIKDGRITNTLKRNEEVTN